MRHHCSPYDFLKYIIDKHMYMPIRVFRNIYPLNSLFVALEQMKVNGEDISYLGMDLIRIENIEDIDCLNDYSERQDSFQMSELSITCIGSDILKFGSLEKIKNKFPNITTIVEIQEIDEMLRQWKPFKGIPITLKLDNVGQLPLNKLYDIEDYFDIDGIMVEDKSRQNESHQGETMTLNVSTYKKIRGVIDNIVDSCYILEDKNKQIEDLQLAIQIVDRLANMIQTDSEAEKAQRDSEALMNASGLVGLLTGKSVCLGYAEIFRNVLSCVNIESCVITGTDDEGNLHAWNQIKIGELWFNVDLAWASERIREGKNSGDMFMSDVVFYGNRRTVTIDAGKVVNGIDFECKNVTIGGHKTNSTNRKECLAYINPNFIKRFILKARNYKEEYEKNIEQQLNKGPIPYSIYKNKRKLVQSVEDI